MIILLDALALLSRGAAASLLWGWFVAVLVGFEITIPGAIGIYLTFQVAMADGVMPYHVDDLLDVDNETRVKVVVVNVFAHWFTVLVGWGVFAVWGGP